jgi:hypothetical protein
MIQKITEAHEVLIREFLVQWWLSFSQEAARTSRSIVLPSIRPEELLDQELGRMLYLIARAAEGQLEHSPETEGEVSMAVFDLLEMLWSRPGCAELVDPPLAFWAGEFGYMVLLADVWSSQDQLITMKDAASLMGVSLQSLRGKINFGVLSEYKEIHEANPRRATRLRLREVQQLVKTQRTDQ